MTTPRIERFTPAFRRTTCALFAAGFSTFALMYCVQPLLPELATAFQVSATSSSLAVSLTTATLSTTLLLAGAVLERVPRKSLIVAALAGASLLTMAAVSTSTWTGFLMTRALMGVAFAGLPAIAMAYVGEELSPTAAGLGMGIYVAGTAVGGMCGRLLAAALTDAYGWRLAITTTGAMGLGATIVVALLLPHSRHTGLGRVEPGNQLRVFKAHLRDRQLRHLFVQGFLFMGVFVAIYNYLTFRLIAPPYELGHAAIGGIFLLYLVGMISSPLAGAVAGSLGRRRTLGLSLVLMLVGAATTLTQSLAGIIVGVGLLTFGFFAAHAIASAWIGLQAGAHKAQAASLYIVFYYVGASVTGTLAGAFWTRIGWSGVVGLVLVQTLAALMLLRAMEAD